MKNRNKLIYGKARETTTNETINIEFYVCIPY